MSIVSVVLIFSFIGTLGARQADIDINRIKLVPKEKSYYLRYPSNYPHIRRSITESNHFYRKNDNDNYSSGITELRTPLQFLHDTTPFTKAEAVKIHQPREDPRFFYQSDSYLQEINRKNINNEVSSIYPGREVVRVSEAYHRPPSHLQYQHINSISEENICLKCPHDRTLIVKAGSDRVMLQYPHIYTCSGRKAPRDAHFVHMYGPKFGSLIVEGSHIIIGRILYKNKILQTCKIQVNVLMQTCPIPKYLVPHCENKLCNFTCRDSKSELHGSSTLMCKEDMKWSESLPVCRAHTWCELPPPPEHGQFSCKGATAGKGSGLAEGSSCRVRCSHGWRWNKRAVAVCRRGIWTHKLVCQPKRTS